MSWLNKLLRRSPSPQAHKASFPVHVELIPEQLSAQVYLHTIPTQDGPLSCWSYVTDGLRVLRQKEIVFTLRRGHDEPEGAFPPDPLRLFQTIYQLAQQGRLADVGDTTQFGARGFFERHLVYISPQPLEGVTLPDLALTALLITEDEVAAVREFGVTRLMARLGQASHYYPCPPWSDRLRPGLPLKPMLQQSLLAQIARIRALGLRTCQEGQRLTLRCAPGVAASLQSHLAQLPPATAVALLTELDPTANACLVWEPGQQGPGAITPPGGDGSRLSGCFVMCVPEQQTDGGQLFEDGFALMLTSASWAALREALMRGQAITILATNGGLSLCLEWQETAYSNPLDKGVYVAPGGWELNRPQEPRADPPSSRVRSHEVRLLSSEQEIARNVSVAELSAYIRAEEAEVQRVFAQSDSAFELLIQTTLHPAAAAEIKMATRGEADQRLLHALYTALGGLQGLHTKESPVTFQVQYLISPQDSSTAP